MKLLKIILTLFLGLILVGIFALPALIKSWATADLFVRQIESELNCRAAIDDVEVSLFKQPSIITLRGLALGPRDEFAALGVPLGDRPPMDAMVSHCESIQLEMRLGSLLKRQVDVQQFVARNLNIQMLLRQDGSNSFQELFQSPGEVAIADAAKEDDGEAGDMVVSDGKQNAL